MKKVFILISIAIIVVIVFAFKTKFQFYEKQEQKTIIVSNTTTVASKENASVTSVVSVASDVVTIAEISETSSEAVVENTTNDTVNDITNDTTAMETTTATIIEIVPTELESQSVDDVTVNSGYYEGVTYTNDWGSLKNIEHACSDLSGSVVPAYSYFSWFEYVGPCIDGYEEAIIIDDSYIPTPEKPYPTGRGGGICVVSSCLRNAVEPVVGNENVWGYNHTRDGVPQRMSYAEIDHQAMIDYESGMDFTFYNPNSCSLSITAWFDEGTKTCYVSVVPVN